MARNQEKAQSMLYRFRESKAIEMGLVNRGDRRPRVASSCTDLRQCERWRGELLREISRKVSKIQDHNLTDYETRDLNDEINKMLREKWHWETQIINLGGANYRRAAPKMVNADGVSAPGMRGYKYFGRAKELPGVKELFQQMQDEAKETKRLRTHTVSVFANQTPVYYGNEGDEDEELLAFEREAENEAWDEQWITLCETLDIPEDTAAPPLPKADYITLGRTSDPASNVSVPGEADNPEEATTVGGKRKAPESDEPAKKSKNANGALTDGHKILTVLKESDLRGPKLPTMAEIESGILARQKAELLREYVS